MSTVIDYASLRGLEAFQAAEEQLTTRLAAIDEEAKGQNFSDEQRAEFEEISAPKDGLLSRVRATIEELQIRDTALRAALEQGGSRVETAASSTFGAPNLRKPQFDVFDMKAYRQRASSIDDLPDLYREGAKRVIEDAKFPTAPDQAKAKEHVSKLLARVDGKNGLISRRVIQTNDPVYMEAHAQYCVSGLAGLSPKMQAALQTYTAADGGYAIPFTIDPTFMLTSDGAVNPLRAFARVETITTKAWEGVTTGGVTAAYAATEVTSAADGAMADVGNPIITPHRAHVFVPWTAEYAEDYGLAAIQSEMGRLIQVAKDDLESVKFVLGTGATGEPDGVIHALITLATKNVETITASTFALDDIDKLIAATPPRFRSRAQFMANLIAYQYARGFGDAGQPAGSIYDQVSKNLRGYAGGESTVMEDDMSTAGGYILLFGDFKAGFIIVDRLGLSVEYIPQVFDSGGLPLGQRGIYARWRNSSGLTVANAFRLLKIKA